jgi:hypothetical protein
LIAEDYQGQTGWRGLREEREIDRLLRQWVLYSGRKITASLRNVTVRGKNMERARGKHDGEESL